MFPRTGIDALENRNVLLLLRLEPQSIGRSFPAPRDCKSQKKGNVHPVTWGGKRYMAVLGTRSGQWRTQEFFSEGGSTNSDEDRENGDLEAVAP